MSILLPALLVAAVSVGILVVVYAVATRPAGLQPAATDPFPVPAEPADTVPVGAAQGTTPAPPGGGWQVTTRRSLAEVEDLLDSLEAHGVSEREVLTLGDNSFAVRWR